MVKTGKAAKVKNIEKLKQIQPGVYEAMFQEINTVYPYAGSVSYTVPAKPALAVTVQKEPESTIVRHIDAAFFDSHTGHLIKTLPYDQLSKGTKIRRVILPIHTGALLGWPN